MSKAARQARSAKRAARVAAVASVYTAVQIRNAKKDQEIASMSDRWAAHAAQQEALRAQQVQRDMAQQRQLAQDPQAQARLRQLYGTTESARRAEAAGAQRPAAQPIAPPPGFYPDPADAHYETFWDGQRWEPVTRRPRGMR